MRIYISGPITGRDKQEYIQHFIQEEMKIKKDGHEVVNPAVVNMTFPQTFTHEEYMRISIAELSTCEAIYLLKGWKDSKGAWEEFRYAITHNMPVFYEEERR